MLAAGGIESYTDTHQLTESRMITWQNDALLMCHLLLLTLLKYLYILYLPSASSWTFYWLKSPLSNTGYISPFTWPWLPSSTIGVPHFFCSKRCPFLSTISLALLTIGSIGFWQITIVQSVSMYDPRQWTWLWCAWVTVAGHCLDTELVLELVSRRKNWAEWQQPR